MISVIIDFCVACGAVLPAGLGLTEDPKCPDCKASVQERNTRLQGRFSCADATSLRKAIEKPKAPKYKIKQHELKFTTSAKI